MNKKEIQTQRIRSYFIDAAKELLKGEGFANVCVRNVADKAGYSYATLYNYFKDLNDLIFECVKEFQSECEMLVDTESSKFENGKSKLKTIVMTYAQYFIEYPGVFELFFIHRISNMGAKNETTTLIYNFLDRLCEQQWQHCITHNVYTVEVVEKKKLQLRFNVMGLLLFYLNRFQPENFDDFMTLLKNQIDDIID